MGEYVNKYINKQSAQVPQNRYCDEKMTLHILFTPNS